jgi:putative ABC transport system permease protein
MLLDSAQRTEGVGADIMVRPPSAAVFLALTAAPMPVSIGQRIAKLDYVQAVSPILVDLNTVNSLDQIWGIDPASFAAVSGPFSFYSGHDLQAKDDILVDDLYAKAHKVKVGQMLHVAGNDFHVAGIVEQGKGARLKVLLPTLQELMGASDKANIFFVKCDRSDHTPAVVDEINQLLPKYSITPLKDYIRMYTSSTVPGLAAFQTAMIAIAVAIGFLVIFLSMYTTVNERTREIGVLKSLGASKIYIARIILSETTLLCISGFALGIAMSYACKAFILSIFPSLQIHFTLLWMSYSAGIAVLGGILGAVYPTWLASRKDPVEALAYE